MNENKTKHCGFIFYPRTYHINSEEPDESYIEGVTESGHQIALYINPDEKDRTEAKNSKDKTLPSVKKLGDSDPRARNICWADPENSPKNPNGILLAERAIPRKQKSPSSLTPWEAKWCSVVKELKQTPDPYIGIGYLEINHPFKPSEEEAALTLKYKALCRDIESGTSNDPLHDNEEKEKLYASILRSRKHWFTAVLLQLEKITTLNQPVNLNELKTTLCDILEKNTKNGIYGGAIIRVRNQDSVVIRMCSSVNARYDFQTKSTESIEITVKNFLDYYLKYNSFKLSNPNFTIEIIPTKRINAAPMTNAAYSEQIAIPHNKYSKTYINKKHRLDPTARLSDPTNLLATRVVIRTAKAKNGPGEGNFMLSTMHAYRSSIGSPLSLNRSGKHEYKLIS